MRWDLNVVSSEVHHPPTTPEPWGVVKTSLLGVVSFGILPLFIWPGRFREFAAEEARYFRAVADWARQRGREPAAVGPLRAAADGVQTRPLLWLLPILLALFVTGVYILDFNSSSFSWDRLLDTTYRLDHVAYLRYWLHQPWSDWPIKQRLHFIWCAGLSAAFLCQWAQVQLHVADVDRFVSRFNAMARAQSLRRIPSPRIGIGIDPIVIFAALIFLHFGIWWAIAMLLAGTAQRRYITSISRRTRGALAQRMRLMESQGTFDAEVGRRCGQAGCQAALPVQALFCPRCGTSVASR